MSFLNRLIKIPLDEFVHIVVTVKNTDWKFYINSKEEKSIKGNEIKK